MKTLMFNLDATCFRSSENVYFAHHFPRLENLEIRTFVATGDGSLHFKTMFRLNQQLNTFHCHMNRTTRLFNAHFFQSVIEHTQN